MTMPSFYDLLKYAKTGIASPGMTAYDKQRAIAMAGAKYPVTTIIGVPPLSFKADGTPLISWSMKGNGSQSGTPTPDAPIMPTFCGVRTGNWFDRDSISYPTGTTIKYFPIAVPAGTYTLSTNFPDFDAKDIFFLAGNVSSGASSSGNGVSLSTTRTRTAENGYVTVAMRYNEIRANPADYDIMLNSGSTALPYEPFGYKIPITCAGQTMPVYPGQTQTVRKVKKLVLTGDEEFGRNSSSSTYSLNIDCIGEPGILTALSSHYLGVDNVSAYASMPDKAVCERANGEQIWIRDTGKTSVADFKSYLAAQYAAGTPVTVWYVLATPETAIVNEPLFKIGTYADELHSADAGVTIPTTRGSNVLTVGTDLQPSSISITGHIKPV